MCKQSLVVYTIAIHVEYTQQAVDDSDYKFSVPTAAQAAEHARQAALMHLVIVPTDARVALGSPIDFTVTMKNGLDQVAPLNDNFAVPIENERGEVVMIKLATFVNGEATVHLQPLRSGYYCITEQGINRKLPAGVYFGLPDPVEAVVYE